jgi:deazaflavin-dependent oxidoreductase (nitroreductase family)
MVRPAMLRPLQAADNALHRLTRGKYSFLGFAGLPGLYLIVPGRISGKIRTTPLQCVKQDGGWLIAGTAFGSTTAPAWVANLRAASSVSIDVRGRRVSVVARELSGAERDEAFARFVAQWKGFGGYERKAGRLIPVFWLTQSDA